MFKICHVCGQEKEHKSWKATTCNDCLEAGVKWCSSCETTQPVSNFHLCRRKPMGMCKPCECKRSSQGKIDNGYYDRPDVRIRRNKESAEWHKRDQANPERRREVYDRHNARNRERYSTDADYREKHIAYNRTRKRGMQGNLSGKDWQDCLEYFENSCAYCGATNDLTRDHIVPVIKQGTNVRINVVVACRSCNSAKHDKDMCEWYKSTPFFSEERLSKIIVWNRGDSNV